MTQTTAGPTLPDGVDILNQEPFCPGIDGSNGYRLVWSLPAAVPDHLAGYDIRLVAAQLPDGTFVTDSTGDHEPPSIYSGGDHYTVADARIIANALLELADLADKWTGGPTTSAEHLAMASRTLQEATGVILTAMHGITNAIEAL